MEKSQQKGTLFRRKILNNKFVVNTIIVLLMSLTVFALSKIGFILKPLAAIVGAIFLPILLAGIFFYLLNPIINFMERKGIHRALSIVILYAGMIALIIGIISLVIPPLINQIHDFVRNAPTLINELKNVVGQAMQYLPFEVDQAGKKIFESISQNVSSFIRGITTAVGVITQIGLAIAMLPILLFYLLHDGRKIPDYIVKPLPISVHDEVKRMLQDMNYKVSSYIRGQIIVSICIGILLFIGYLVIGLESPLLLAVIAMATNVVPYFGPTIAVIPAGIIALAHSPLLLFKVVIVWAIAQLLESKGISPLVMGRNLHLHPVTVIFVIIIAGSLFGILGFFFAVPGYTVLKVIITHIYKFIQLRSSMHSGRNPGYEQF